MKKLIAIGYWKTEEEPELPSHLDHTDPGWQENERSLAIIHLQKGIEVFTWKGFSWCRFGCGIPYEMMGNRDLSDGTYIWPEGLPHYLAKHSVRLPDTFIEHIRHFKGPVPEINPYNVSVDFNWWISQSGS